MDCVHAVLIRCFQQGIAELLFGVFNLHRDIEGLPALHVCENRLRSFDLELVCAGLQLGGSAMAGALTVMSYDLALAVPRLKRVNTPTMSNDFPVMCL